MNKKEKRKVSCEFAAQLTEPTSRLDSLLSVDKSEKPREIHIQWTWLRRRKDGKSL